jgi:transposase-like protein
MSSKPRRQYPREFKLELCRQLARGDTRIVQVCREHALCRSVVERWREVYAAEGENAFQTSTNGHDQHPAERSLRAAEARIAALESALGRASLELDLLRRAVEKGGCGPRSGVP